MKRSVALAVALGLLVVVASTPAHARPRRPAPYSVVVAEPDVSDDDPAVGLTCGMVSATDPTVEDRETQIAVVFGGPLVVTTPPPADITLKCTIQVGTNSTHAGADACVASAGPVIEAVVLPPTLCPYRKAADQPVYLCTEIKVGETTYYWDPTAAGGTLSLPGAWSTSQHVPCKLAIVQEILPGPLFDPIDEFAADHVAPVVCPVLAVLLPPEGDTDLTDCPPYDT